MTTIIAVGDIHMSDRPPVNATDSYSDDIIEALLYVAELEKILSADAVVWAGDVFDHKSPSKTSHATILRMIEVVRAHKNLWVVVGNHDISNDRLDSVYEKQPLGVLLQSGAHELNGWHPSLPLYGVPWQQDWDAEGTVASAFEMWREDAIQMSGQTNFDKLAVTHASIFPPGQEPLYEHLSLDVVSDAMNNEGFLYYGHIHEDHGVFNHRGVQFANVGAISRGSLTEYNTTRQIQVCVWTDQPFYGSNSVLGDYDFKRGFNPLVIPHKPASEVFRTQQAVAAKSSRMSLEGFLSQVGSSVIDISSAASVAQYIQSRDDIPDRIKRRAMALLEETR